MNIIALLATPVLPGHDGGAGKRVTDGSGNVLLGAVVQATNEVNGYTGTLDTTSAHAGYLIPPAGTYETRSRLPISRPAHGVDLGDRWPERAAESMAEAGQLGNEGRNAIVCPITTSHCRTSNVC